jgi:hypothetical protein
MTKAVATITAAAVLLAYAQLFAQGAVPAPPTSSMVPPTTSRPVMDGEKNARPYELDDEGKRTGKGKDRDKARDNERDKDKENGKDKEKKAKGHGKGHGKKRGLDRADEVAGEHGQLGRANARGRGKHGNREQARDKGQHEEREKHEKHERE